ncbi:MAG: TonB-dependent receptor [Terracidiphilus sp.]
MNHTAFFLAAILFATGFYGYSVFAIKTSLRCVRRFSGPPVKREVPVFFALLLIFFAASSCLPSSLFAAEIRGNVVGVRGEPLARVQVSILELQQQTITGDGGGFVIAGLAPGEYTLQANAVGYWLVNVRFSLAAGEETKDFEITLTPDNVTRTDTVEVKGDKFQGSDSPAILKTDLTAEEIRQTSTVLADDPFRSIQALPGVSAAGNNDFFAQFSVMGAQYQNVGIYIDGILVPSPFHGVEITQVEGATLSIFTAETFQNIQLLPAAYPEKYGDDVGAALELETRNGSRTAPLYRISAGLADSEVDGEGPLGGRKLGSWLASARKSYLSYLFRNRLNDTSDDVGFYDADLKLNYDIAPNQSVDFYGVGGPTSYQLINPSTPPGPNDIYRLADEFMMGRIGWRWVVDPRLLVEAHGAHFQQPSSESNISGQPLDDAHYAEWVAAGSAVWSWRKDQVLEGGWMARRASAASEDTVYMSGSIQQSGGSGEGWKNDGYVQQSSALFGNRVHLAGGLRLDTAALFDVHPLSPQISAAWQVAPATQLQLGYGRYHQFYFPAEQADISTTCPEYTESLQTANHYVAALEQRVGESTRVTLLLFDRNDDYSYDQSVPASCPFASLFLNPGFQTISRDYSRGAQIVLQSRTANRLSGWIGYTLAYARQSYCGSCAWPYQIQSWSSYYPTLADQRHTLNLFANYRLTPTLNLGGKFLYGSGYPASSSENNSLRLGDYQRLDVRAEKDWAFRRWKLAVYAELLNATNHYNPGSIFTSASGSVTAAQGLPITPTAGVAFEF